MRLWVMRWLNLSAWRRLKLCAAQRAASLRALTQVALDSLHAGGMHRFEAACVVGTAGVAVSGCAYAAF